MKLFEVGLPQTLLNFVSNLRGKSSNWWGFFRKDNQLTIGGIWSPDLELIKLRKKKITWESIFGSHEKSFLLMSDFSKGGSWLSVEIKTRNANAWLNSFSMGLLEILTLKVFLMKLRCSFFKFRSVIFLPKKSLKRVVDLRLISIINRLREEINTLFP